ASDWNHARRSVQLLQDLHVFDRDLGAETADDEITAQPDLVQGQALLGRQAQLVDRQLPGTAGDCSVNRAAVTTGSSEYALTQTACPIVPVRQSRGSEAVARGRGRHAHGLQRSDVSRESLPEDHGNCAQGSADHRPYDAR